MIYRVKLQDDILFILKDGVEYVCEVSFDGCNTEKAWKNAIIVCDALNASTIKIDHDKIALEAVENLRRSITELGGTIAPYNLST